MRLVPLAPVTTTLAPYSCTCPSGYESVEEGGKPRCRIVVCGVAPQVENAVRNDTGKIPHGHTVRYSCDVGHTIEDGVLDAPTPVDRQL